MSWRPRVSVEFGGGGYLGFRLFAFDLSVAGTLFPFSLHIALLGLSVSIEVVDTAEEREASAGRNPTLWESLRALDKCEAAIKAGLSHNAERFGGGRNEERLWREYQRATVAAVNALSAIKAGNPRSVRGETRP